MHLAASQLAELDGRRGLVGRQINAHPRTSSSLQFPSAVSYYPHRNSGVRRLLSHGHACGGAELGQRLGCSIPLGPSGKFSETYCGCASGGPAPPPSPLSPAPTPAPSFRRRLSRLCRGSFLPRERPRPARRSPQAGRRPRLGPAGSLHFLRAPP